MVSSTWGDRLFVYGALRDARVLNVILGYEPQLIPAILPGYSKRSESEDDFRYPTIRYSGGDESIKGFVIPLHAHQLSALDHWQGHGRYTRKIVTLGDQQPSWVYYYIGNNALTPEEHGIEKKASSTSVANPPPKTGPEAIAHALANLNIDDEEKKAWAKIQEGKVTHRRDASRRLAILQGLRRNRLKPSDFMMKDVPVIPARFRPYSLAGDTFILGDANELYRDLVEIRGQYKSVLDTFGYGSSQEKETRKHLMGAVRAVSGHGEPVGTKTRERGASGFLQKITGTNPKTGMVLRKLTSKTQDLVGRGVIVPNPELGMDEMGLPRDMAWSIYSPFVQRRLVKRGLTPENAILEWKERTPRALEELEQEMKTRPVVISRAPAWHKFNVTGSQPRLLPEGEQSIQLSPLTLSGYNADFDGDTMNVHAVVKPETVREVYDKMMPSKMLFTIRDRNRVMPQPSQEAVLGLYTAIRRPALRTHTFASEKLALQAIERGEVDPSDNLVIQAGQNAVQPAF